MSDIGKIKVRHEAVRALGELHTTPSEFDAELHDVVDGESIIEAEGCRPAVAEAFAHYAADVGHLLGRLAVVTSRLDMLHRSLCARLGNCHPITRDAEMLLGELRGETPAPVVAEGLPPEAALAGVHEQLGGAVAQPAPRPTESGWAYGGEGAGDD